MAVSTLKEVLKRSNTLIKRTVGRGRNAVSMIASRSMLLKSLLQSRKKRIQQAQMTFAELLPKNEQHISAVDVPDIEAELLVHQIDILYRAGSPPGKLIS
jgi:hypothetical protein